MNRSTKWSCPAVLALVAASLGVGPPAQASSPPSRTVTAATAAAPVPLGQEAVGVARAHLAAHADEFGLSAADVDQLAVSSVVPTGHNGLTNVYFQQRVERIDVSDAMLNVAVTNQGAVLRVASNAVASAAKRTNSATPTITDVAAARLAADALGLHPTSSFASGAGARGPDLARDLGDGGISLEPIPAQLVYEQTEKGALRLSWELVIEQVDGRHWWQISIDARTGVETGRADWVAEDTYRVFPMPTEAPTFALPVNTRTLVSNPATSASPFGWNDTNGALGAESTLTTGNNVNAYTDTNNDNLPDAASQPDGGAGLAFDFPLDLTQAPAAYRPAAVTNLYFANNRIHDIMYRFGFNESAGNFQANNYAHGGLGADAVNAEAQDGGDINNARFGVGPDGVKPRMQMYLWNLTAPGRDGDFDNGVIAHEYGHGISNRLTGGPATVSCLQTDEQAGEGWSDFYSYMLTMTNGTEPAGGRGIGTYVLGQATNGVGIRSQRYSTNPAINTKTYDSIKTATGEHAVGEVWAEMLWEVTYALIGVYGFNGDLTGGPGTAGNILALQLVTDGLKLQACNPGFVDARNAIIAADQIDTGGANRCLLWTAFAKRGLGFSASQGSSGSVTDGTQAFDLPAFCLPPPPPPPATAPGAPVITSAKAMSPRKARIKFTLASNGGSPVTSYAVTCSGKKGAKKKTKTGPASPIKVKGLTPGKKYTCTVTATNAVGTGPASAKSKKFKMPPRGHSRVAAPAVAGRPAIPPGRL